MFKRLLDQVMPQALHAGRLPKHLVPILIVAYSCLVPREFTIELNGAALFPYRLALILMLPFAIAQLAKSPVRPSLIDACAGFASLWFITSLVVSTSYEAGLISGTSYAIDYGLAYLLGRASIRTAEDLRLLFRYFLPGIVAVVVLLAAESLSHRMLLRPNLADLLGKPEPYIYFRMRFGLLRAMGPFPHPILGGLFLALVLPFAWYLAHNLRVRMIGCAAALGSIFTVSSTAMMGVALAAAFVAIDVVQRRIKLPLWPLAAAYLGLMVLVISVVSESGVISFLIRNLTFDTGSGYYRLWIWEYAGAEAMANPLFGIGLRDWVRPIGMNSDSVDSYWLIMAMVHGFPALVSLALVMIGTMVAVLRTQKYRHAADADAAKAVIVFIGIAIFSGFTVHFWESIGSWMMLVIGGGVSLATQARYAPAPEWHVAQRGPQPVAIRALAAEQAA